MRERERFGAAPEAREDEADGVRLERHDGVGRLRGPSQLAGRDDVDARDAGERARQELRLGGACGVEGRVRPPALELAQAVELGLAVTAQEEPLRFGGYSAWRQSGD